MAGAGLTTDGPSSNPLGLTREQWRKFLIATHGFSEQDENGVDLGRLRENLGRSSEQRLAELGRLAESTTAWAGLLEEHGVRAVLIGGVAMCLHGSSYLTRDIDFYYSREPQNLEALARALKAQEPRLRGGDEDLPLSLGRADPERRLQLRHHHETGQPRPPGDVRAAPFDEVRARAVTYRVEGQDLTVATLKTWSG